MNLAGLPKFAAVFALRDGTAFLFDFEERTVCVLARGGAVPFDAGLAAWQLVAVANRVRCTIVPSILLVAD